MHYSIGQSELESTWLSYRPFLANWVAQTSGEVVARAELAMLSCTNSRASNDSIFLALDESSQESSDFGQVLTTTYRGHVATLFKRSRHLANFSVLEVNKEHCGRGLGLKLGLQLLAVLERRYGVGITILKPFPLQFQGALPPPDVPEFDAGIDRQYRSARFRLARKYAKHWGAWKLPGSAEHMMILGRRFDDALMLSTRSWWTIK